jgi:hypothetical protein
MADDSLAKTLAAGTAVVLGLGALNLAGLTTIFAMLEAGLAEFEDQSVDAVGIALRSFIGLAYAILLSVASIMIWRSRDSARVSSAVAAVLVLVAVCNAVATIYLLTIWAPVALTVGGFAWVMLMAVGLVASGVGCLWLATARRTQ